MCLDEDKIIEEALELFWDDDAGPEELERLIRSALHQSWEEGFQAGLSGMR